MGHSYRLSLSELFDFEHYKLIDFFATKDEVRVRLKNTRTTGTCPVCDKQRRNVEDTYERRVRDLDISGKRCYVYFEEYKINGCSCGYRGVENLDFVDRYSLYTTRFEEFVAMLCKKMTIKDASDAAGITWRRAKEIDKKYLSKLVVAGLESVYPRRIGIDEIAYEKGHKYLTVVRDVDSGKVIWVGDGRKKETLDKFFRELGEYKSALITVVVMDMWKAYIASVEENAPNAEIVFDKFHVAKKVNEALDKVRRQEFAKADADEKRGMKKKRFIILARSKNLKDPKKRETLRTLMATNKRLYQAYLLKEQVLDILDKEETNPNHALKRLEEWFENVAKSGFSQFAEVVETIRNHLYGIENFFKHQLTNAASEGFNTKINVLKRRAYGFRDLGYFKLKILQYCGGFSP